MKLPTNFKEAPLYFSPLFMVTAVYNFLNK